MTIPLSLYVHIPWCVQKCPYCDFNSHTLKKTIPEDSYVKRLLYDMDSDIQRFSIGRPLTSIFIGGGTPSLFSGHAITKLMDGLRERIPFDESIEITLEANPGTVDEAHFRDYLAAGINRLSIGVQSFNALHLEKLGRIHSPNDAERAVKTAQDIGFNNINIDIMFGLPEQTEQEALYDIDKGMSLGTEHLSYYQLTLEPNTAFAKNPPQLPHDENIDNRFELASEQLVAEKFSRYEVSAWSRGRQSKHNCNYWQHGDYLGIGAGAHGKITTSQNNDVCIIRTTKPRSPKHYLLDTKTSPLAIRPPFREERLVEDGDKAFEFMLNTLRLSAGFDISLIEQRGLFQQQNIQHILNNFVQKGLLTITDNHIRPTELGYRFVNEMVEGFL